MSLNVPVGAVVSIDAKGVIEYWDGDTLQPLSAPDVQFRYKGDTDLFDLAKVCIYRRNDGLFAIN
jgi:hypothetical protein